MPTISILMLLLLTASPLSAAGVPKSDLREAIRLDLLVRINADRMRHGLAPVAIDRDASRLADRFCELQIRSATVGHFATDGVPPYERASAAGIYDAISENTVAWSATYRFTDEAIFDLARRSHDAMMAERPPDDGHRKTILDPSATHVGIGLAWEGGEFRLAQEFVRRYVDWRKVPAGIAVEWERFSIAGVARAAHRVVAVAVHFEPIPPPLAARVANEIEAWALPEEREIHRPFVPDRRARLVLNRGLRLEADGSFHFDGRFERGPGLYTIVVWVSAAASDTAIPASNISIRVERSRTETTGAAR